MKIRTVEEIRKKWVQRFDAEDDEKKPKKHSAFSTRLPYGLCNSEGIKTEGMTPREAWEAYEKKTGKSAESVKEEKMGAEKGKSGDGSAYKRAIESGSTLEVKKAIKSSLSDMPNGYTAVSHGTAYKKIGDDQFEYETPSGNKKTTNAKGIMRSHSKSDKDGDFEIKDDKYVHEKRRVKSDLAEKMTPSRDDYDYEVGDDIDDFVHKNVGKLQDLYDEGGSDAIDSEFYKFRLHDTTKNIHEISKAEADEIMYDNVSQSKYDGWFRAADSGYKPYLVETMVSSPEIRNAGLSLAYENYKASAKDPLPFEEFLVTPIKMYRGDRGQKTVSDDVFDAYSFDKRMAESFMGEGGKLTEVEIRPIDTYGSMRCVGEAEIWVPREISEVREKGE